MVRVSVILDSVDHECCGPRREVGDVVKMHIHNYQGQIFEERHPDAVSIATQLMTGTIVGMEWRPEFMHEEARPEGFTVRTHDGYGPGTSIDSTDFVEPDVTDWVFQFTVETDDSIPEPRKL